MPKGIIKNEPITGTKTVKKVMLFKRKHLEYYSIAFGNVFIQMFLYEPYNKKQAY